MVYSGDAIRNYSFAMFVIASVEISKTVALSPCSSDVLPYCWGSCLGPTCRLPAALPVFICRFL